MRGVAVAEFRCDVGNREILQVQQVEGAALNGATREFREPRSGRAKFSLQRPLRHAEFIGNPVNRGESFGQLKLDQCRHGFPETRINWRWMVEELPSTGPEDQLVAHDYLSLGVEFDDGQDLTYYWSRSLPTGTVYRCPIPRWTSIETHMVVRSGLDQLGQWVDESRDVYADYKEHINGEAENIVRVWLLAVTIFQRRGGACRYAAINLEGPSEKLTIL